MDDIATFKYDKSAARSSSIFQTVECSTYAPDTTGSVFVVQNIIWKKTIQLMYTRNCRDHSLELCFALGARRREGID